jgi:hypothetical protein
MSDEFSDLRLFTKMVSAGSLSETTRRLNSSLTAMSRRLSQMEERLGVRLIDTCVCTENLSSGVVTVKSAQDGRELIAPVR